MKKESGCQFIPNGEVEKRCLKCGYVIWRSTIKSDHEVVKDMIELDYPKPDCYNESKLY